MIVLSLSSEYICTYHTYTQLSYVGYKTYAIIDISACQIRVKLDDKAFPPKNVLNVH